jgi:hypothetical protein
METIALTRQQSRRIAELPENYRVVGVDQSAPFVREPDGGLLRIQRDGRLTPATRAARRTFADERMPPPPARGVQARTSYTHAMD